MAVSVQGFTTLVENQVAAIQGVCSTLIDFTIGSILRSFVESVAGVALFLQAQALQDAALTRAATSNGADLDSFFADFGFTRLPAEPSTGQLTFSRFTSTNIGNLPVGTVAQSFDGSQQFIVLADPTNAAYVAASNSYTLAAGVPSITVLAQSVSTGTTANVAPGTVSVIVNSPTGISTVTNTAAFAGGVNAESDPAFRARWIVYLASLSKATRTAILYAVSSVQAGLSQSLVENQSYSGATQYGYFYDVVDDGSGSPPSSLLAAVGNAIDQTRALGISFSVFPPALLTANIGMTITTAAGYTHSTVAATVQDAMVAFLQSLGLGVSLPHSRLAQVAYDASPAVTNVTGVLLNSGTADLTATAQQRIVAGTVTVT